MTQSGARHGASPHVLHPRHGLPDALRRGVLVQGELCAHLGGVLQEAHAGARPRHVERLHDADDEQLDQLEVGRAHALGAVDHKNQIHGAVATRRLCGKHAFALLPVFCQNEALRASADVGVSGADALVLTAMLEGLTHIHTCEDTHTLLQDRLMKRRHQMNRKALPEDLENTHTHTHL